MNYKKYTVSILLNDYFAADFLNFAAVTEFTKY